MDKFKGRLGHLIKEFTRRENFWW